MIKHGHNSRFYRSSTYLAWRNMKDRCNNPGYSGYQRYGGRGITYDPRWEFFQNFLLDMGGKPETVDGLSLDRKDNDGNYTKDNCRWATVKQQQPSPSVLTRLFNRAAIAITPEGSVRKP